MVLLESGQLGHGVYITSYMTELKKLVDEKVVTELAKYFYPLTDLCIEFTRVNCAFPCAGAPAFLVNHMIRIIECYMEPYKPKFADEEAKELPADIKDKLINALIFAATWGIGGVIDEHGRGKFDTFLQDLINGEDVVGKYHIDLGPDTAANYPGMKIPNRMGDYSSIYDIYFD
jgi:hypothetical protein